MNDHSDSSSLASQAHSYVRGARYQKLKRIHAIRLLLLYVVPFVILALYFLFQYEAISTEGELVHLQAKSEENAGILDLFLSERLVNLSQLMTDPAFRFPPTTASLEEELERLKAVSDAFVDLGYIDAHGVQTAYSGPHNELVGRDYSGQTWYSDLRNHDLDYLVTDIHLGFRGSLHVTIAVRRVFDDGTVVLKTTLEPSKIREGIHLWTDGEDIGLSIVNRGGDYQLPEGTSSDAKELVVVPPESPRSGTASATQDGEQKTYAYAWLRSADWAVVARPHSERKWGAFLGLRGGVLLIATGAVLIGLVVINIQAGKLAVTHLESETAKLQLAERAKELACLYRIGRLVERYDVSLDDIFRGAVGLIRDAFKDPELTAVRIDFGDREFLTPGWKETPRRITSDIKVNKEKIGKIDVCQLQEPQGQDEEPFLAEETQLLDAVAERLGKTVSRQRIEDRQRLLVTAIEHSAESVTITDTSGTIEYVNPAFSRISGYEREEVIGENPRILKSGKHSKEFYQEMWQTILGGETWEGRFTNRRKDGTFYEVDCRISPVRDSEGDITNFVAVKHDITEMVKLESNLRQAQKMEAVGQLAGGIAHDFNNILTVILTNAHYLARRVDESSSTRQDVEEIRQAAERAASLTRQLLAFSRQQVVEPVVVDLNQVLANTEKMLRRLIGENIELVRESGSPLDLIYEDPSQVEQVILNLAVNGRDAMRDGGKLTLSTANVVLDKERDHLPDGVDEGPYVQLRVADTGCGMDEATRERIFEPFFTTKDQGKGTGLGLATVYGIVTQGGGYITVESEPGKGSTFNIHFRSVALKERQELNAETSRNRLQGTETILVVEDDESVRQTAARILRDYRYTVIEATGGREALRLCQSRGDAIDLLITDVVMPEMSGRELASLIVDCHPGIRVLYMSGYASGVGSTSPEDVFIPKPLIPDELARKVRETLDRASI